MEIKNLQYLKLNQKIFLLLFFLLNLFYMGQSTPDHSSTRLITDRTLSFIAQLTHRSSIESKEAAIKTVTVNSIEELNLLKEMFHFRLKYRNHLTHCYGYEVIDANPDDFFSRFICKGVFSPIKVNFHYEKIIAKFPDIYQIPIEHGLNLLAHCLVAYSILYDEFGYFTPQARQINKQGKEWKVWINENIFALKSKSKNFFVQNQPSKQKFLQQIIHLFDVLRDDKEPGFSYSVFIYGSVKNMQLLPSFQLNQILELINGALQQNENSVKKHKHKASLRRVTLTSNQTVRRLECNTLISFDEKANEESLAKFNHNKNKKPKKSLNQSYSLKDSQKQNIKFATTQVKCQTRHQSLHQEYTNSSKCYNTGQKIMEEQNHQLSKFRQASANIIFGTTNNDHSQHKIKRQHHKNSSLASTLSNCTSLTKNIKPLQIFSNKLNEQISLPKGRFIKKQRSYTTNFTNNGSGYFHPEICEQPKKITENSEMNSDSDQIDYRQNNFDKAFLQSDRSDINQENKQLSPVQIISKNPTSHNTPSIAHKTPKCGNQTMKLLKEYLIVHSKGQHKRSLSDHACLQNQNKIRYCWSQEFDSEFISLESRTPSNPNLKSEHLRSVENQHVSQQSQEDEISHREVDKKKTVKITFNNRANVFNYNQKVSDTISEMSNFENQSESNGKSLGNVPIFKFEGFKSLLGSNKLNTLKSINQIQVDQPIDEDILKDLNKMFTRHRFAKSTKLTKMQDQ